MYSRSLAVMSETGQDAARLLTDWRGGSTPRIRPGVEVASAEWANTQHWLQELTQGWGAVLDRSGKQIEGGQGKSYTFHMARFIG